MRRDDVRLRVRFLSESRDRLARARAELADEFSQELRHCRDRCIEARILRGEDAAALDADETMQSDTAKNLIREIASHPALGERLRALAGRIEELDGRLSRIETELVTLTQAHQHRREVR